MAWLEPSIAQRQVLVAFAVATLALIGWGSLFRWLCGYGVRTVDDLFGAFFEGWALVLGVLQIWHFVAPIDARATTAVVAIGAAAFLLWTRAAWVAAGRGLLRNLPALALVIVAALWLSGHALGGPRHGDAGAYYIPTTIWMHEFPLVVGLGNLSAPYAYNQSYFLYAAAASVGPFAARPWHIVNAILVMGLLARGLLGWWHLMSPWSKPSWNDLAYALLLPGEIALTVHIWLTSQAPDTGIFLLGAALFASLLAVPMGDARSSRFHLLAVALFTCAGWTIKVAFAGMAGALAVIVPLAWWHRWRPSAPEIGRTLLAVGAIALFMVGPWLASNVVMSGCPLFPSARGALDVPWRVQLDVQSWIESDKYVGPLSIMWRNPAWFVQRLIGFGWDERAVALPLFIGVVTIPVALVTTALRHGPRASPPWWILVPPVVSLVFAMRLTPQPRYAGATMWLFGISAVLVACGDWLRRNPVGRGLAASAVVVLALAALPPADFFPGHRDFIPAGTAPTDAQTLPSGLTVHVPRGTHSCFAAPQPCTPHLDPRLALRRPGELASGFFIDETRASDLQGDANDAAP